MLVIFLYGLSTALFVAGAALIGGPGLALIVAGACAALAAYDLSTEPRP